MKYLIIDLQMKNVIIIFFISCSLIKHRVFFLYIITSSLIISLLLSFDIWSFTLAVATFMGALLIASLTLVFLFLTKNTGIRPAKNKRILKCFRKIPLRAVQM